MNKLFFSILAVLVAASIVTYLKLPSQETEHTYLSWSSDPNPARYEQIDIFQEWMKKKHPEVKPKANGNPEFEVKLFSSNNQSMLIQAVSGVAGDLLDAVPIPVYADMGLLTDVTEHAKASGYGADTTYPGAASLISYEGKQFGYPCNLLAPTMWINHETFEKYDIPIPEANWTPEEFERIGKLFNERVKQGDRGRTIFFTTPLSFDYALVYGRSLGTDSYNETMTRSTLSDPRFVAAVKLIYKWTYVDRILPTAAEVASNTTETGGFGGAGLAHFIHGNYAMIITGRYALIRFRELPKDEQLRLSNVMLPQYGFPNLPLWSRSTAIYAGSKYADKAEYFLEFLASKEYNDTIIHSADGLPPTPKYAMNNPEYLRPAAYPNEGAVHENELKWALNHGIPTTASPYFKSTGTNWSSFALDKVMADRAEAPEALKEAEARINDAIAETVAANDKLRKMYNAALEKQLKIDAIKAGWKYDPNDPYTVISGEKIPEKLILNPYHLRYYDSIGMLKKEGK